MAESKTNGGRHKSSKGPGMNVDTKLVRELAELLNETGLTEIEVEDDDRRIRVARGGVATAPIMAAAPAPLLQHLWLRLRLRRKSPPLPQIMLAHKNPRWLALLICPLNRAQILSSPLETA